MMFTMVIGRMDNSTDMVKWITSTALNTKGTGARACAMGHVRSHSFTEESSLVNARKAGSKMVAYFPIAWVIPEGHSWILIISSDGRDFPEQYPLVVTVLETIIFTTFQKVHTQYSVEKIIGIHKNLQDYR